eukprot:SAG31_NODE_10725_length_1105_cov_1.397614_1_plen_50_part_10
MAAAPAVAVDGGLCLAFEPAWQPWECGGDADPLGSLEGSVLDWGRRLRED